MPPANPADEDWADLIDQIASAIGYEAAYNVLKKERDDREEAMRRHVFTTDGAAWDEIAKFVKEHHPEWQFRVDGDGSGVRGHLIPPADFTEEERTANLAKCNEIMSKWNKFPGLPEVAKSITIS